MSALMDKANTMGAGVDAAVIEELREALEGGNLVLFVGGGISAAAGLPTWRQLAELATERVRERGHDAMVVDELSEFAQSQRYIEALAAAEHALGAEEFAALLERELDDAEREVPPIARALAALRDRLRAVVTTNINHLLERAFEWEVLSRVTDEVAWRRRFILKLHGTLRESESWIFTRERFHATLASPPVRAALSGLFARCPVLFVGFGRADENFDQMLQDVRGLSGESPPPRFALVPTASLMPYRRRSLVEMGFRLLPYDNLDGGHARALELLDRIRVGAIPAGMPVGQIRSLPPIAQSHTRPGARSLLPPDPAIPDLEIPPSSSGAYYALPPDWSLDDLPSSSRTFDGPITLPPITRPSSSGEAPRGARSEPPANPIEVFFSYSERDRDLRDKLERHLAILKRKGVIRGWHEGEIGAGEEWDKAIREHLESAKMILLLVSADFLASDFCYEVEMQKAIERHKRGEAKVIPVILDACDWEPAPFGGLRSLPNDGRVVRPVTSWSNQSEAFASIAKGIRKEVEQLTQNPS